jgi:hypothetical protein
MAKDDAQLSLNPQALTPYDAARALTAALGAQVYPAQIEADVAKGAPTNADGSLNLVHYAAWLVKEMSHGR